MKCFYCDSEMIIDGKFYTCNKLNVKFGHVVEMHATKQMNDIEISFYINENAYGNYEAIFYSVIDDYCSIKEWKNSFFINSKDFITLKQIKNLEQLQHFTNKLKVFK